MKTWQILASMAGLYLLFPKKGKATEASDSSPPSNTNSGNAGSDLYPPVSPLEVRNDNLGLGHYHAPRGSRLHKGVDFEVYKDQAVYSPTSGYVTRSIQVYSNDTRFTGCEIVSGNIRIKIFYMVPTKVGHYVHAGELLGYAQAISEKYSPAMQDHIHIETYVNDKNVNPMGFFEGSIV